METLAFVVGHYAVFGIVALALYGLGRPLVGWMKDSLGVSSILAAPLQLSSGMGVSMVVLFGAGVLGQFKFPVIAGLVIVGLGLALVPRWRSGYASAGSAGSLGRPIPPALWWWIAIAAITVLPMLLSPLRLPLEWDELMYHLPYARHWAQEGGLTVNPWLRYPLFAYNLDLLYGAALVFDNDILPHLLHALTGALAAILTFAVGSRFLDWRVGLIAAFLLLRATRWGWSTAYIDLGLMLFWFCALAALALRHVYGDRRLSYLAAFFAGIAVGIKYQGLIYLPALGLLAIVVERRPAVLARGALILAATGGYWYLRNWLISGDPVHPIGGPLFGFWLWNVGDLQGQFGDLDKFRGWPEWFFAPALGAILFWRGATTFYRGLLLTALGMTALWYLTSGYPRYLLPAYPLLALLTGAVVLDVWSRSGLDAWYRSAVLRLDPRLRRAFLPLLLVAVAVNGVGEVAKSQDQLVVREEDRGAYLERRFPGYGLLRALGYPKVGPLYQLGFERELYYLGDAVRGDWFGPGRYADVMALTQDAAALAQHLERLDAAGLLVNLGRLPFSDLAWDPRLAEHFELIGRSDQAVLYRLRGRETDPVKGPSPLPIAGDPVP